MEREREGGEEERYTYIQLIHVHLLSEHFK